MHLQTGSRCFRSSIALPSRFQSDGILIPSGTLEKQRTVETVRDCLDWTQGKARPVVPIRIRRSVVRVDVARAIIAAVIHVPTTAHRTDYVGINEVGVIGINPHECALQPQIRKDYSIPVFLPLVFGRKLRISYEVFWKSKGPAVPSAAYAAFTPTGRRKGPTRSTNTN